MKASRCLIALLACAVFLLGGCTDQSQPPVFPVDQTSLAKVAITKLTFTSIPVGLTGEGEMKLVGECWILKDVGVVENVSASDPLVSGTMIHSLSGELNAISGEGPIHGSWTLTPTADVGGGVWEGSYHGYRNKKPGSDTLFALPLLVIGHGRGGTVDRMQLTMTSIITAWGTPPTGWYGVGDGFYKSPGHN